MPAPPGDARGVRWEGYGGGGGTHLGRGGNWVGGVGYAAFDLVTFLF